MKKPKLLDLKYNEDFVFVGIGKNWVGVKILEGPYVGICYKYASVSMRESKDGEQLGIKFTFDVLSDTLNGFQVDQLNADKDFTDLLLNILVVILSEELHRYAEIIGDIVDVQDDDDTTDISRDHG